MKAPGHLLNAQKLSMVFVCSEGGQTMDQIVQEGYGVSVHGDIKSHPTGQCPAQSALADPA